MAPESDLGECKLRTAPSRTPTLRIPSILEFYSEIRQREQKYTQTSGIAEAACRMVICEVPAFGIAEAMEIAEERIGFSFSLFARRLPRLQGLSREFPGLGPLLPSA